MKKFFTWAICLIGLIAFSIHVQAQEKPVYANVAFHKLKPGHSLEEAMNLEKRWKTIHLIRKDLGLINAWGAFPIIHGYKTPSIDYDYISVNVSSDLNKITQYPMDKYQELVKKDPSFANILTETEKVQSVTNNILVKLLEGTGSSNDLGSIIMMETMKTTVSNYLSYVNFEKQMKGVHQDRIKAGEIQEWSFWQTIVPVADDSKGQFTAFTYFKDLAHLDGGGNGFIQSAQKRTKLTTEQLLKKMDQLRQINQMVIFQYAVGTWN